MQVFFTEYFKGQLKKLKRKYPRVKEDFLEKLAGLELENEVAIGRGIFKIRIGSLDQRKGRSGGFRAYVYMFWRRDLLVPLCIYSKAGQEGISENELEYYFRRAIGEMLSGGK